MKLPRKHLLINIALSLSIIIMVTYMFKSKPPNVDIFLQNDSDTYTIKARFAQDLNGEEINSVRIYKNNNLFFRGFPYGGENYAKGGLVTFIFDDGWLDTYTNAFSIFDKYDYPATLSVIQSYVDTPNALSARHIRKLIGSDWDIASHAISDIALTNLDENRQKKEVIESKEFLWGKFWATNYFIYPSGEVNDKLESIVQDNYLSGRGYSKGLNTYPIDPFNIQIVSVEKSIQIETYESLVEEAILADSWLVFVLHHVSENDVGEFNITPLDLERLLSFMSDRRVRVATLNEALQRLDPEISLVVDNELAWKFDKKLVKKGDKIQVYFNDKYSKTVKI